MGGTRPGRGGSFKEPSRRGTRSLNHTCAKCGTDIDQIIDAETHSSEKGVERHKEGVERSQLRRDARPVEKTQKTMPRRVRTPARNRRSWKRQHPQLVEICVQIAVQFIAGALLFYFFQAPISHHVFDYSPVRDKSKCEGTSDGPKDVSENGPAAFSSIMQPEPIGVEIANHNAAAQDHDESRRQDADAREHRQRDVGTVTR